MKKETCLSLLPIWLILFNQSLLQISGSHLPASIIEEEEEEPLGQQYEQPMSDVEDEDTNSAFTEAPISSNLASAEEQPSEELGPQSITTPQDLDDFLSQFVLIKTPYGYILARSNPNGEMLRLRRSRQQAEKNFQLRVRKDLRSSMSNLYRDRKSNGVPFKSQNNFQLRVRKSTGTQSQATNGFGGLGFESNNVMGSRVRKAILQEIRDRRRMAADHSNNNFQLRVRKAGGPGHNFQLRVRRSAEW